jgi:hypothetical protein
MCACARAICSSCSRSFYDRSHIVLFARSMRRECHESVMSNVMLTPTEQALMRLHNYGCSNRYCAKSIFWRMYRPMFLLYTL